MMICRNCGKVLKEYDKFCSNCGTIVEREGTEEFVFTAPERDFEWNVHSFPTGEHQKTEDAVFDWGIDDSEFRRRPRSESDSSFFENKETFHEPDVEPMKEVIIEPIGSFFDGSKPEAAPEPAAEPMPEMMHEPITGPAADEAGGPDELFAAAGGVSDMQAEYGQMPEAEGATEQEKLMERPVIEPLMEAPAKPKEKKSFFARFSKDKNATLEQPVITDEQIEQARAESLQNSAMDEAAAMYAETPEIPEFPRVQQMPEMADIPDEPIMPEMPEMPAMADIPDEPIMPEMPEMPAMADIPDEPIMPEMADIPEMPGMPEAQAMGYAPEEDPLGEPYHVDFDWEQQTEPVTGFEAMAEEPGTAGYETDAIISGDFERELFGGSAVAGISDGGEGLSRYSAGIDRFYTVNKRNEEFQKLLDNEYEKFREGRSLDDGLFSANVQAIKDSIPADGHGDKVSGMVDMAFINDQIEKASFSNRNTMPYEIVSDDSDHNASEQTEERAEGIAEEQFAGAAVTDEQIAASESPENESGEFAPSSSWAAASQSSGEFVSAAAEPAGSTEPAQTAESAADLQQAAAAEPEEEEKFDKIKEMFGFEEASGDKQAQDSAAADGTEGGAASKDAQDLKSKKQKPKKQKAEKQKAENKGGTGGAGKIVIVILSVILAVLLIALGIKLIAPSSSFAQQMDNIVDSFTRMFTGEQSVATAVRTMIIGG